MKTILLYLWVSVLLVVCAILETRANSEEWGIATNGLRMRIGFKNQENEIKTNQSVRLLLRIQNVSSNEVIGIACPKGQLEQTGLFSFVVISPSGKDISPDSTRRPYYGSAQFLRPDQVMDFVFELSRLCQFTEIGTYKITAKTEITRFDRRTNTSMSFWVVSNQLLLRVVSETENPMSQSPSGGAK